ncbi:HAD family hydrolase [Bergeyella sp. RCAD1439]|uniref:HAD family hydrolase n=1 Tax=Bergeyella anatis TaxID=3113737 RepID=UPI002E19DB7A|nr:HAD family hydrolase [Bergeyella sp. RCAD1439]
MKKLYCFDFDGTLTNRDTMFLFLRFYRPSRYYVQYLKHLPLFVLLKLRLVKAEGVKKSFISGVLKGETRGAIERKAQAFFQRYYPEIIRENALEFIANRDRQNTEALLVTASMDLWVRPFAEKFGMSLLATEGYFQQEVFTGEFKTPNCNGEQKVFRIRQFIEGKRYDKIIAFGDTSGDRPMMKFADDRYYRFFH